MQSIRAHSAPRTSTLCATPQTVTVHPPYMLRTLSLVTQVQRAAEQQGARAEQLAQQLAHAEGAANAAVSQAAAVTAELQGVVATVQQERAARAGGHCFVSGSSLWISRWRMGVSTYSIDDA